MRVVFIVVGLLAILGLLVHGLWALRRNSPAKIQNRRTPAPKKRFEKAIEPSVTEPEVKTEPSFEASEPKPAPAPVPPRQPSLLEDAPIPEPVEPVVTVAKRAAPRPSRQEPTLGGDQIELGFGEQSQEENLAPITLRELEAELEREEREAQAQVQAQTEAEAPLEPAPQPSQSEPVSYHEEPEPEVAPEPEPQPKAEPVANDEPAEPNDVLVLHVMSKGEPISGAELLPNLLTMGFKFGEMDIFHRHQSSAGTGPVLFSLANMVNPGTFNPDHMEQFTTEGVALFMTLPSQGDPRVCFSMMEGAAKGLADLHGAEVLDGQRQPWTQATQEAYLARIQRVEQPA
ncbi:cell division protein ZipA [Ferrimonas balearica]|uniref:cell division protein ZipA n=1 Tax=Ferrimonas balearica TaxID=44012 RepID=UPI001C9379E0|nr:cell division protein ZipA [Ferrimonas balearica]MBY6108585.1 cell division protein ZipA [Ferrimonas balearica]